jgi:hypothetical protein
LNPAPLPPIPPYHLRRLLSDHDRRRVGVASDDVGHVRGGVEIDSLVADDARSLIREQVEMGVAAPMAALESLARNLPNG